MNKSNHFDDFLKEEGIYDEVQARTLSRALTDACCGHQVPSQFLDDAARADVAMQESGVGYAMPEVHAYIEAKVRGEPVKRPSPVKWRR